MILGLYIIIYKVIVISYRNFQPYLNIKIWISWPYNTNLIYFHLKNIKKNIIENFINPFFNLKIHYNELKSKFELKNKIIS